MKVLDLKQVQKKTNKNSRTEIMAGKMYYECEVIANNFILWFPYVIWKDRIQA